MLSKAQQKTIRSLQTKKGREKTGLCLVEGRKVIETAGDAVEYTFTREDVELEKEFLALVTTETPQEVAAVARCPQWSVEDVLEKPTVVVLDGVQDPGNVGAILRLALGFDAGLLFIESADPTSPKVIRSSVGAMFQVPWVKVPRAEAANIIEQSDRRIYRLEKRDGSVTVDAVSEEGPVFVIAGSEGQGIALEVAGQSVTIPHDENLESLNVANALAITLFQRYRS